MTALRLALPVLVGADGRDRFHVRLATAPSREHSGPSLAEILDDLALEVMEAAPKSSPEALARYVSSPDLQLRRVKIELDLPLRGQKPVHWKGRVSVVIERWPGEPFRIATVPRLGAVRFPVPGSGEIEAALVEYVRGEAPKHLHASWLDGAAARLDEHLELLEIDVDLPSVLTSRAPPKRRKKRRPDDPPAAPDPAEARKWVAPVTLRSVAVSLGHRALDGSLAPAFGRDALVDRIVRELARPGAAVLLVGPSGVGKTAIVHEVVRRTVDPHVPLTERTDAWQLDGNRLIAGMSVVGAWERRVEDLVAELHARQDLLVVDDLPTLVWTGRSAQSETNVAGFLEPHLARGELRILGECTAERLAAARDEAPGFFDRFRILQVPPLDERETLLVALRIARALEVDRPLRIAPDALTAVTAFTRRFQAHRCQPGAAVTLLRRVVDEVAPPRLGADTDPPDLSGPARPTLDRAGVMDAVATITGLPGFVLDPSHAQRAEEVRAWFDGRVLAQPNAADAVVDVVCTLQQGLNDPHRPLATLMLAGPTGVGKTETAKALAAWLFGSDQRLVRFDMSEFGGRGAAARLIGDVANPEGELTRAVTQQPFSVVLFDEIEKAHPAIYDVMLQVMGEGRLTNAVGRTVDLTSTVILLTSNLGVAEAGASVGFGAPTAQAQDAHYASAVQKFFRPEFVNRIDRVVPYRALRVEDVGVLVERLVGQLLERRGLRRSGVAVSVDPDVVGHIVAHGFSAVYGARALKRTLEAQLTVPLARELVARPPAADVRIEVYPRGERLEVGVEALEYAPEPVGGAPPAPALGGLRRLADELGAALGALVDGPVWARVQALRAERLNAADGTAEDVVLQALVHLEAAGERVGDALEDAVAGLEIDYEDEVAVDRYEARGFRRNWLGAREKLVTSHRPIPVDLRRLPHLASDLHGVSLGLRELVHFAAHVEAGVAPVLVRVLPETPDSAAFAGRVAAAIVAAWSAWGAVEGWHRVDGGATAWRSSADVAEGTPITGHGLVLRVPGLRPIAERVAGLARQVVTRGPDTVAYVARIDVLPPSDADPAAQLAEADAAWQAWREARKRGDPLGPCPRPNLPVTLREATPAEVRRWALAAVGGG